MGARIGNSITWAVRLSLAGPSWLGHSKARALPGAFPSEQVHEDMESRDRHHCQLCHWRRRALGSLEAFVSQPWGLAILCRGFTNISAPPAPEQRAAGCNGQ